MLTEAVILAGGLGTRLRDVVADLPKVMAIVNGKPFLDYLFTYLDHYKVERKILSVGYLSEKITKHYGNACTWCIEKEPMGTGGGIRLALEQCESEEILVMNGDTFFDINLDVFYDAHKKFQSDFSLAIREVSNAGRYGTIERGEKCQVKSFKEKSGMEKSGFISAGVYILNRKKFLKHTPADKAFSIEKDFFEQKVNEFKINGFPYSGYFMDIGIPEDYKRAQDEFKEFEY